VKLHQALAQIVGMNLSDHRIVSVLHIISFSFVLSVLCSFSLSSCSL